MQPSDSFYRVAVKLLGLTDLNPLSQTAGCSDRGYWHYQDGKGFAVGSFQLSQLCFSGAARAYPASASLFRNAARLTRDWWAREMHRWNALPEYYWGQESFCATAHTTLGILVSLVADEREGNPTPFEIQAAVKKALRWLSQQTHRPDSANQTLAARLAWDLARTLTWSELSEEENPFIPEAHSGWLSEYGGFDLGYSLVCLDLCALALGTLGDTKSREPYTNWATELTGFLQSTFGDFTFAAGLGSRGNPHRLLGGLLLFARSGNRNAISLIQKFQSATQSDWVSETDSDDKYRVFFHAPSLLLEHHANRPIATLLPYPISLPDASKETDSTFLEVASAGLVFLREGGTRLAISGRNGGAAVVETQEGKTVRTGYLFRYRGERWTTVSVTVTPQWSAGYLEVPLHAVRVTSRVWLVQNLLFQLTLRTLLMVPRFRAWVNRAILERVNRRRSAPLCVGIRRIQWAAGRLMAEDEFDLRAENVHVVANWSMTDGHSTRLFGEPVALIEIGSVSPGKKLVWFDAAGVFQVTKERKAA